VRVSGLPSWQRPAGFLAGPDGLRRRISRQGVTVRNARPGLYTLTLQPVTFRRSVGSVKRGALASPAVRIVRGRVHAGASTTLRGSYTTIVNPGVVSGAGEVLAVGGDSSDPSWVTLSGHRGVQPGAILSIAPSAPLPRGLLAHVRSVSYSSGNTTVAVAPASPYEVMPVARFEIPLHQALTAHASSSRESPRFASGAGCNPTDGPYRNIKNVRFSGGWNTVRALGKDIPIGLRAQVDFDAEAGFENHYGLGIDEKCEASLSASGMAGPIPVTAAIYGQLKALMGAGLALTTGGSVHVSAAAHTIGLPPTLTWWPTVGFSSPHFTFSASTFTAVSASVGVGVKAGLGNENIADATLNFSNSLDFTADPNRCSWDARFGQFSAEGKLLDWTIESPKTPALLTKNLYRCRTEPLLVIRGSQSYDGVPNPGTLAQALNHLGQPSTMRGDGSGVDCNVTWRSLGIDALFQDFAATSGQPSCRPNASFSLSDMMITGGRWVTDRGVRVGDPVAKLVSAYPDAQTPADCVTDNIFNVGVRWRLQRTPDPSAINSYICTLAAYVNNGKVVGFELSNPGSSE
jgi:hypothetical protein